MENTPVREVKAMEDTPYHVVEDTPVKEVEVVPVLEEEVSVENIRVRVIFKLVKTQQGALGFW